MKKFCLIFTVLCLNLLFVSTAFADHNVGCSLTISFQGVTKESKMDAVNPNICFQDALRVGCRSICAQKRNASEDCQSSCIRSANLTALSCNHPNGDCSVYIERNRKELLSPSAKSATNKTAIKPAAGSSAPLLTTNSKHKTNAKRSDYLILDRKAAKKAPLINTTAYYAKSRRYGTGDLLKPASSSREPQSDSKTLLSPKKKRQDSSAGSLLLK